MDPWLFVFGLFVLYCIGRWIDRIIEAWGEDSHNAVVISINRAQAEREKTKHFEAAERLKMHGSTITVD